MRGWIGGLIVGLAVCGALFVGLADAQAPRQASFDRSAQDKVASSPDLLALSHDGGDGRQQITVIDPKQRVMAVYTIDRASGALALKSVRNLSWDLQIEDYNPAPGSPAPRDIRALREQQR